MSRATGFLQLRRGFWEHVRDGRMSITMALCFIYICSEADTRTGVWVGSAGALRGELGIPERTARDVLEKLARQDYVRRFTTPGSQACYPILVHKYQITDGEHDGEQLNALGSTSPIDLAYFPREQNGEHGVELGVEHGAAQRRSENRELKKRKNPAAKTTPPADPRFRPFFTFVYEAYRSKHGQAPNWTGKDGKLLRQFLAEHPHITAQEFQRRFGHYLNSTEDFTRKQGASLAYFVAHFDVFLIGPLSDRLKSGQQARDRCTDSPAIRAEPSKYDSVEVHRVINNGKLHAV